ncbi:SDR family oxidoreductase [Leifsonia sp. NPDC058248]|uniref:SDR family oxidoreductase n=1 Tax=Leifsonia sp. NPDC058248 TaxID=3346402 RepID=UPI0036DE1D29
MTVLVVGGTGRLGRLLVRSLTAEGERIRVLTRDPAAAGALRAQGVEAVVGDLRDPGAVRRAVAGCAAIVAAASGFGPMGTSSPQNVDRDGNLALFEAARQAGVDQVVLVSMHGAAPDAPLELLRMKYAAEQALIASGVSWTIIRPTAFLETYLDVVAQPMRRRGATLVFGRGDVAVDFVSVTDVAALIRVALRDPGLRGRAIDWGGAEHTLNELSDAIHAAAGRPGPTRHVPLTLLRVASVVARPFSPFASRVTQAAVELYVRPARFDSGPERARHPELPVTSLAAAIAAEWPEGRPLDRRPAS